jgi:hypothetical protein
MLSFLPVLCTLVRLSHYQLHKHKMQFFIEQVHRIRVSRIPSKQKKLQQPYTKAHTDSTNNVRQHSITAAVGTTSSSLLLLF